MKKTGIVFLVVAMMLFVAACSGAPAATQTEPEQTAEAAAADAADVADTEAVAVAETGSEVSTAVDAADIIDTSSMEVPAKGLKFGLIAHDRAIEWVNYGCMNFEYACNLLEIDPVIVDAQNNMEKVLSGMEDLLAQKVDAVSVYSFSPDLDARVCQMARDAGIPIIMENAKVADDIDCDANSAFGYVEVGTEIAKYIEDNYPGSRVVYIMGQPGMNITELYNEALETAMADGATFTVVDRQPTNWTSEEAMNAMQNVLQSGREFDVIFSNNEQITKGVLAALEGAGVKGEYPIVTTGGSPLGEEMIRSGDIECTMDIPVSYQAMTAVKDMYSLLNGNTVEKFPNLPIIPITKDNVDTDLIKWPPSMSTVEALGGLLPS